MIEPLRRTLRVACSPAHAFATWTARASAWWPPAHTMSGERGVEIVFEPKVGGRIFERTVDGREFEWGEITVWEPPGRLGYRWSIATTREHATDVEIRFQSDGEEVTRVEIEHRGWERLGDAGPSWRDVNQGGWDGTLPAFARAATVS
ncbi:MAG TPA: SRPBCC domain-containing protein [Candidatus Dormibacteraeota bacterium]